MAIRYKRNCVVCQLSRKDPKFRHRVYMATFKPDESEERIYKLGLEYKFANKSMYNHCKKHISKTPDKTPILVEKGIARVKGEIAKELELSLDHDEIIPKDNYEKVIDSVLEEGLSQMRKTGKNITVSQMIAAAKVKADYMTRKRGQDVELIKTMYQSMNKGKDGSRTPAEPSQVAA